MSEKTLTPEQIHNAVRNDHPGKTFTLGDREFPIKDLGYDDYMEFVELSQPILSSIFEGLKLKMDGDNPDIDFDPSSLDIKSLIKLAGDNLPRMAWLCCKQSDPKITVAEVKQLGRRPQAMLTVILAQVKHNKLVQEFADFFQSTVVQLREFVPDAAKAVTPQSLTTPTESTTAETRS